MVPNVTFLILNGVVGHKFRTLPRSVPKKKSKLEGLQHVILACSGFSSASSLSSSASPSPASWSRWESTSQGKYLEWAGEPDWDKTNFLKTAKFILLLGRHRWLAERIPLHYPRLCCLHQCQCCHFPSTFTCFDIFLLWSASITNSPSQGGILGVAGKFPPAYMGAVFAGQVCKDILFFFLSFF